MRLGIVISMLTAIVAVGCTACSSSVHPDKLVGTWACRGEPGPAYRRYVHDADGNAEVRFYYSATGYHPVEGVVEWSFEDGVVFYRRRDGAVTTRHVIEGEVEPNRFRWHETVSTDQAGTPETCERE